MIFINVETFISILLKIPISFCVGSGATADRTRVVRDGGVTSIGSLLSHSVDRSWWLVGARLYTATVDISC